jgi:acetylornithine deacetylase/succinyl-diaminopimelate desuccinylase-like protein
MNDLLASDRVRRVCDFFTANAENITEEQIRICTIPAPPFGEAERAQYFLRRFRELGLTETGIDAEGNCVGLRRGRVITPLLVISAHLDTVFPPGTDFSVTRNNGRLLAPGIADDGCGLVALVAILQALNAAAVETEGSLLFVATVGEEGEGNLRGARYLFTRGEWAGKIDAFISFDGPDVLRITNGAIGSRRYHIKLRGSGGHSWGDFGVANPVHALGRVIARLAAHPVPVKPRTTFNVGRISGGTGTNVIPVEATMDVDLRSESAEELRRIDAFFRRTLREAVEDENGARDRTGRPLELDLQLIGERPMGETPRDSPIIRLADEATRAIGADPKLDRSSTDSNIPISLGVPAVTLGAGGYSGKTHTLEEWYDPRDRHAGLTRAVLLALSLVGT